ncbi:hypothetical protein [Chitinophaga cymbidii]|uniref:Uncharacterized protein n=1 Tax=Chitinophaga cymbidii TaxID=1096750 RepID=A0A512RP39_9BACT|nr:hypothetical protein [Chitinophaga cymbidii]GEP97465.1 hypothetical protein CCY01nite_37250 [Chitinophaga cymbidii]
MRFLLFIIILKGRAFLNDSSFSGGLRILFFFLMLLTTGLYAAGAGLLLNSQGSSPARFMSYLNLAVGALVVLKGYFPSNVPFRHIFLVAHPLSATRKALLQACYDLVTPFYLLVAVFYIVLALTADGFSGRLLAMCGLNLLAFYFPERILKMRQWWALLLLAVDVWGGMILTEGLNARTGIVLPGNVLYMQMGIIFLAGVLYVRQYKRTLQKTPVAAAARRGNVRQSLAGLTWAAIARRRQLRVGIMAAYVFKTIFCVLVLVTLDRNRARLDDLSILLAVFCSPVVICNYVLNNLFGYVPQVFVRMAYMVPQGVLFRRFLSFSLRLAWPDFLLSLGVLLAVELSWKYPLFLICAYANAAIISFLVSALAPRKVSKAFDIASFRSNTSILGNILLGGSTFALFWYAGRPLVFFTLEAAFLLVLLLVWRFGFSREYDRVVSAMAGRII